MQQIRRAFLLATAGQYFRIVLNFVLVATISHLLTPAEVGTSVLGMGATTVVFSLREFLTSDYLIQLPKVGRRDVRTAMTLMIALTFVLAIALNVASPFIAAFYGQPALQTFILIMTLAAFFECMTYPSLALLKREMSFGKTTIVDSITVTVSSIVTLACAMRGFSFMSFAIGNMAGNIAAFIAAQFVLPSLWSFQPSLYSLRTAIEFGRYRGGTNALDRAYDSLPLMILGSVMPSAAVGTYNRASLLSSLPDKMFLSSIFAVAFPALAAGVRAGLNIKTSYLHTLSLITSVYWPASLLTAILINPIVNLVLGEAWRDVAPIAGLLLVSSCFWFPVILTAPVLIALGANKSAFWFNLTSKTISVVVLSCFSFFGLYAIAMSQFICLPVQMVLAFVFVMRYVKMEWAEIFGSVVKSMVVTVTTIAGPLVLGFATGFKFDHSLGEMLFAVLIAAIGFATALVVTQAPLLHEIRGVLSRGGLTAGPATITNLE